MYKNQIVLLILLTSATFQLYAQHINNKETQTKLIYEIDNIIKNEIAENNIPGAVIQIKKGNKIIYKTAYGYAQKYDYGRKLLNQPEPMTTEHLFDIASLTKVVGTTTSIMILVDRGLIKVSDSVGKYIKAFNAPDKKSITIGNLLSHNAGLYEWYPLYYKAANKQDVYKLIGELPLNFPVGKERHYSDLGFTVLGEIIETVSGLPLEKFIQENISLPLGMQNTTFNPLSNGKYEKIAASSHGNPYEKRMVYDPTLGFVFKEIDPKQWDGWRTYTLKGEVNDGNTWYAGGGVSGAAGLFSTIDDLQKLVDMLMNKGKVGRKQFISKKTITSFLTKDDFKNGLGWMMDPENPFMKNGPEGTFGHTGFSGTSIAVIPQEKISILLLINRQNMDLMDNDEYFNLNPIRQQIFNSVLKNCK